MSKVPIPKLVILLLSLILVGGVALFGGNLGLFIFFQVYVGYFFCLALVSLTLFSLLRNSAWKGIKEHRRFWLFGLVSTAFCTYLILLHEPSVVRVVFDEPAHLSTARTMSDLRMVSAMTAGYYEGGTFAQALPAPAYRMYLYSFFVSLLNDISGYRMENGFIINGAACFVLMLTVYGLGGKLWRREDKILGGFVAQSLLLTLPLLAYVANSAGYDTLNLALLVLLLYAALNFAKSLSDSDMELTLLFALLLAYTRNESVLFLLVFCGVYLMAMLAQRQIRLTWITAFSPLFLLVPISGRALAEGFKAAFPVLYGSSGVETWFSLSNFPLNAQRTAQWFLSLGDESLNSIWLPIILLFALLAYIFGKRIRRADPYSNDHLSDPYQRSDICFLLFAGTVCLHFCLILFMFWNPVSADAVRFLLPMSLLFVLGSVWLLGRVETSGSNLPKLVLASSLVFFWFSTLPKATRASETHGLITSAFVREIVDWVDHHDDGRTLYVYRSNLPFALYDYPCVSRERLLAAPENVDHLLAEGLFDRIVLFQQFHFSQEDSKWQPTSLDIDYEEIFRLRKIGQLRKSLQAEVMIYEIEGTLNPSTSDGSRSDYEPGSFLDYVQDLRLFRKNSPTE